MTNILVDTSVLIRAQNNPGYFTQLKKIQEQLIISRITACELIFGSRNKAEKRINGKLVELLPIEEVNEIISQLAYTLIDTYNLKSRLSVADAFIAATALERNIPLWTINTKHFKNIKGLKLFEPHTY